MKTNIYKQLVCTGLLLASVSICVRAQQSEQTSYAIGDEEYNQVLDLLFPRDSLQGAYYEFATVLRYMPSFDAESQIVMVGSEGYVQVTEYKSLDGNLNYKLSEMVNESKVIPAELAKRVRVSKREIRLSYLQAQTWRKHLIESMTVAVKPRRFNYVPPPKEISVVADGTIYELWDASESGDLHFELVGGISHKSVYPVRTSFINWMDAIRREVGRRK